MKKTPDAKPNTRGGEPELVVHPVRPGEADVDPVQVVHEVQQHQQGHQPPATRRTVRRPSSLSVLDPLVSVDTRPGNQAGQGRVKCEVRTQPQPRRADTSGEPPR